MEAEKDNSRIQIARRFERAVSDYIDANIALFGAIIIFACVFLSIWSAGEMTSSDWSTTVGLTLLSCAALALSAKALSYRYKTLRESWSDVVYANSMKYSLTSVMFIVTGLAVLIIHVKNIHP